jgi:hypothetical protein
MAFMMTAYHSGRYTSFNSALFVRVVREDVSFLKMLVIFFEDADTDINVSSTFRPAAPCYLKPTAYKAHVHHSIHPQYENQGHQWSGTRLVRVP